MTNTFEFPSPDSADVVKIHIEEPAKIRVTTQGTIEVLCYQETMDGTKLIPHIIYFSPEITGTLVYSLQNLLENNLIRLTNTEVTGLH